MLDRRNTILAFCACAALIIVSTVQFGNRDAVSSWLSINPMPGRKISSKTPYNGPLDPSVQHFFEQVFALDDAPELDLTALERECAASEWQPNLYFECYIMDGGLTTLISEIKTCMHMAIELGANLIIPTTPFRVSDADLSVWDDEHRKPLGMWFEREFLIERMQRACPKMHVTRLNEKQEPDVRIEHTVAMNYSDAPFQWGFGPYETVNTPWQQWFKDTVAVESAGISGNIRLQAATPSQFFNVTDARHDQRAWFELSHLLRSRIRPRKSIDTIRKHMSTDSGVKPYIGVHFRVENDVIDEEVWTSPERQITRILETVEQVRLQYGYTEEEKLIYIACGDEHQLNNFKVRAFEQGWTTVDKWSIAAADQGDLAQMISELDFDHEAMIDMGMLVMSDFFIGLGASAFSFTIAHDRSPTGRYQGSSLGETGEVAKARSHLYQDGGFAYQCCL